ncbi:hypothetical protein K1T71_000827 [Dendrolimus kikuchii]|uniref:Uncharacterized protein n=1 Tax=Dendrolimus kikuchii TaxID=765133 RepID=A0ACC1DKP5_9NEOP|nr:hypothetical protein K1T71_000827 [Dendrolimus kikuchii]
MEKESDVFQILLPHHEQQPLCTTRLPYRQGRKLTAVKVYTINNESAHLLIFNVPTLNLKQETKSLFSKFGKILQFNLATGYKTEKFTEAYHVLYERIQSARFAKKMTDGKGFYVEVLHVCYAPEFETLQETKQKLMQRRFDVARRLNTLHKQASSNDSFKNKEESEVTIHNTDLNNLRHDATEFGAIISEVQETGQQNIAKPIVKNPIKYIETKKLYMGDENTIYTGKKKRKREKEKSASYENNIDNIEVIDCTNVNMQTITNINEGLNYNNFGNELVRKVVVKPAKSTSTTTNEVKETAVQDNVTKTITKNPIKYIETKKLHMGHENTIYTGKKKKSESVVSRLKDKSANYEKDIDNTEVTDCTNVNKESVTDINKSLNYNNFGNEIVRKVVVKPVNRIIFNKND